MVLFTWHIKPCRTRLLWIKQQWSKRTVLRTSVSRYWYDTIFISYYIKIYIYIHMFFSRSFWLTFSKSLGPRQRRKPTPTHSATMRRAKLGKRTRRLVQARADFRSKLFRDFRVHGVHGLTVPQAVSMWADRLCRHWYAAQAFSFALHASNYSWVFHSIP